MTLCQGKKLAVVVSLSYANKVIIRTLCKEKLR